MRSGRLRHGKISLFQRFMKVHASTAVCIWQKAEAIPELHEWPFKENLSGCVEPKADEVKE